MPFQKGHTINVGSKTNGRKSLYEEENKAEAINGLWKKVRHKVENDIELTETEEKWVSSILPKTIKTEAGIKIDTVEVNEEVEELIDTKINDYLNEHTRNTEGGE